MQQNLRWIAAEPTDDSEVDTTNEPELGSERVFETAVSGLGPSRQFETHSIRLVAVPSRCVRLEDLRVAATFSVFENLLTLEEGWNGQGSGPVTEAAWGAAKDVLRRFVRSKPEESSLILSTLRLIPLSSGGLHLVWRRREWVMTIEIPYDGSTDCDYFGKDGSGFVQGNLTNERQFLDAASFLANRLAVP